MNPHVPLVYDIVAKLRSDLAAAERDTALLRAEVARLQGALHEYADHAENSGWFNLADEIRKRVVE